MPLKKEKKEKSSFFILLLHLLDSLPLFSYTCSVHIIISNKKETEKNRYFLVLVNSVCTSGCCCVHINRSFFEEGKKVKVLLVVVERHNKEIDERI